MYDTALSPLSIGNLRLRNRVVRSAHGVLLPWTDDGTHHIAYHRARAQGGVALSIMGIGGVHASNPTAIPTHEDRVVVGLSAVAEAVHEDGMALGCQIWHGGAVKPNVLGGAPWSASQVVNTARGVTPIPMTKIMIDEMVASFASAARRVKEAGLDLVEIHAANGYLITQFLSPASNQREDEYGGSFENRLRFLDEVLDAVRAEVGQGFPVGVRLSSHEFVDGGLVPEQVALVAQAIEPKIDFLDVSLSGYWAPEEINAPSDRPMAYQVDFSSVVTKAVSVPTMVAGRIMTMDVAEHIVSSGAADMVSMVRGLMADPEIVNKSAEGRPEQVRPCIGILECVSSTLSGSFSCAVNPAAGHELQFVPYDQVRTEAPRKVMIVGGGPAGMEAARSAALRGHDVTLYEVRRELGGQIVMAARAPFREDYTAITSWQEDELRRLGVTIKLGTGVDPDTVLEQNPDVLVLATGSEPRDDGTQLMRPVTPFDGFRRKNVYSSWDLFSKSGIEPGTTAVVFDDTGLYEGLAVADALVERGVRVTFATPVDSMGERIPIKSSVVAPTLRRLAEADVRVLPRHVLLGVDDDGAVLRTGDVERRVEADSVFVVGFNRPQRDLLEYLEDFDGEIKIIGDAAGFHTLSQAIHDGDAAGRAI